MADEPQAPARLADVIARRYDPRVQITPAQIEVIAGAIAARGPRCQLLVFGTGYDSPLWVAINVGGRTLFVEDVAAWADRAEARHLEVARTAYSGVTVAGSLAAMEEMIARATLPAFLANTRWDVILIDGPRGWQPDHPGRAFPVRWAAQLQDTATHVFLHDCERQLETALARRLLLPRGPWTVIAGRGRERQLLWSIGRSASFPSRPNEPPASGHAPA